MVETIDIAEKFKRRTVEHLPIADDEVECLLLEKKSTVNTGEVRGDRTVLDLERI